MATLKQIAANRANAERSTGPRTRAGKARSRLNSWKHGLTAARKFWSPMRTGTNLKPSAQSFGNSSNRKKGLKACSWTSWWDTLGGCAVHQSLKPTSSLIGCTSTTQSQPSSPLLPATKHCCSTVFIAPFSNCSCSKSADGLRKNRTTHWTSSRRRMIGRPRSRR